MLPPAKFAPRHLHTCTCSIPGKIRQTREVAHTTPFLQQLLYQMSGPSPSPSLSLTTFIRQYRFLMLSRVFISAVHHSISGTHHSVHVASLNFIRRRLFHPRVLLYYLIPIHNEPLQRHHRAQCHSSHSESTFSRSEAQFVRIVFTLATILEAKFFGVPRPNHQRRKPARLWPIYPRRISTCTPLHHFPAGSNPDTCEAIALAPCWGPPGHSRMPLNTR